MNELYDSILMHSNRKSDVFCNVICSVFIVFLITISYRDHVLSLHSIQYKVIIIFIVDEGTGTDIGDTVLRAGQVYS